MEKGRVHVIVTGYVQGVFFRASTRDIAVRLGLTGWVRNLPDGSVEASFEGSMDKLREAVQWCHRGPAGARVIAVEENWLSYSGEFGEFNIIYRY